MGTSLYPPERPLSIGEIVDAAFRIFRVTVLRCLPFALIAVISGQLSNIYYLLSGHGLTQSLLTAVHDPLWDGLNFLGALIGAVMWSAILLRQHAVATGARTATGQELGTALMRMPAVVMLGILGMAAIGCWFLPGFLFPMPVRAVVWFLMLIPASMVMVALSAGWASLLLTDRGPVASLVHSWRLTSGSLWRLTGVYTVAFLIVIVIYVALGLVTTLVSLLLAHNDIAIIAAATETLVVIMSAVVTPFYCALALAVLGDLRVRKEGTDLAQRISAAAAG